MVIEIINTRQGKGNGKVRLTQKNGDEIVRNYLCWKGFNSSIGRGDSVKKENGELELIINKPSGV